VLENAQTNRLLSLKIRQEREIGAPVLRWRQAVSDRSSSKMHREAGMVPVLETSSAAATSTNTAWFGQS